MSILGLGFQKTIAEFYKSSKKPVIFPHGKNLFNKMAITEGVHLNSSGGIVTSANYGVSDYIPITLDSRIHFSNICLSPPSGAAHICFYDDNKNLIPDKSISHSTLSINNYVYAVGSYMRVSFYLPLKDSAQIEYGIEGTGYENFDGRPHVPNMLYPQDVNVINPPNFPHGKNLFNKADQGIRSGYFLSSSGNTPAFATSSVSGFIPVIKGAYLHVSHVPSNANYYIQFYDAKKEILSGSGIQMNTISENKSFVAKGEYFRFTFDTVVINSLQVEYGTIGTSFEEYTSQPSSFNFIHPQKVEEQNIFRHGKNLFDKTKYQTDRYINSSGNASNTAAFSITDYIAIKSGANIVFSSLGGASSVAGIAFYDEHKVYIPDSFISITDLLHQNNCTRSKGAYMRATFYSSVLNSFQIEYGNIPTNYQEYEGGVSLPNFSKPQPVTVVSEFPHIRETEKYRFGELINSDVFKLLAVYEKMSIYTTANRTTCYFSSKGIENYTISSFTDSVGVSDLPDVYVDSAIASAAIFYGNTGYVTLLFTNKNQIYYSDGTVFGNFKLADVWTLPGDEFRHHSIALDDKDPSGTRYRMYVANNISSRSSQFTWFNSLVHLQYEGSGTVARDQLCFANYQLGTGAQMVPSCMFSTENGKDIYVQYMFGANVKRAKIAGTTSYENGYLLGWGDTLDTSAFTNEYVSGLILKTRIPIIPSETEKEQTDLFEMGVDIAITAITKGLNPNVTVADASSIVAGDTIVITGDASDAEWNNLRNTTASAISGGNGRIYYVTSKSGNVLKLAESIGNPNNNLFCRHIHCVNPFGNGLMIGTGEMYPYSWMIYNRVYLGDSTNSVWQSHTRINSSSDGLQRPIGVILLKDDIILFASDEGRSTKENGQLVVRGTALESGLGGMWYGKISEVDYSSKFENKIWNVDPFFKMVEVCGVIFASTLGGSTWVSFDRGNTFEHVYSGLGSKQITIGFDKGKRRWYFGNCYFELK